MKAVVVAAFNKPWELRDQPEPVAGPGQVVIKTHASGVCGAEIHLKHGHFPVQLPCVAGHEPIGEVVALGAGVTTLKVGDRVGVSWHQRGCGRCQSCQSGRAKYCAASESWMKMGGGFAELFVAWAEGCTLIPPGLDAALAAPIMCAGFTVLSGLRNAEPRAGERVAVLGIGGLGHLAIQFAAALGFETIAITNSPDKIVEAKRFGASDAISGANPGEALQKIGGADIILATTDSAAQVSQALGGLRPEGRLVSMGAADGPIQVAPILLIMKQIKIVGSTQNHRADLVDGLAMAAAGKVKPVVETFPFSRANDALDRLEAGKMRYRGVLVPG